MLQDFESVSDHFGTLYINGLKMYEENTNPIRTVSLSHFSTIFSSDVLSLLPFVLVTLLQCFSSLTH